MKIGIMTFPNSISFGATLQMYALFTYTQKMGFDVEIINYCNNYMKDEKHCGSNPLRRYVKKALHCNMYRKFKEFEKNCLRLYPGKTISDKENLKKIGYKYDYVICGSDQVWNPNITGKDLSFFLDFCSQKTKRISYAPSFGVEHIDETFQNEICKELLEFSDISIREREGQQILETVINKPSTIVLDPTFLLSVNEWKKLEKESSIIEEPFILYYTVRTSDTLFEFCNKLSEKTGLKVVVVGGNIVKKIQNKNSKIVYAVDIGPDEWLNLMHRADYIVTNSFHGTAFSIIYQKQFFVEFSSFTNSRLEHITRVLGLEKRVVNECKTITEDTIDYNVVKCKLDVLVNESKTFLNGSLSK